MRALSPPSPRRIAFVSVCTLMMARSAAAETVDELLAAALRSDPTLQASDARMDAADADVVRARAAALPRLTATGGYTRNQVEAAFTLPGTADVVTIQKRDQLDATVRAEVPLFDAAAWAGVGAADACRDARQARSDADRESALLAVLTDAWAVRTAQVALDARQRVVDADRALLARAETRQDVGVGPTLDVLNARAELARAEEDHLAAVAALRAAQRRLAARTGGVDAAPTDLAPRPFASSDAATPPELRAADLDVVCEEHRLDQTRWGQAPTVSAFAQERLTNAAGFTGRADTWAVGVSASWVAFDGGAAQARNRSASASVAEARATRLDVARRADDDLAAARDDLEVARAALRGADAQIAAAEESRRVTRERLDQGTATPADVAAAERVVADAVVSGARAAERVALGYEALRRAAGAPLLGGAS
jgi:outer membrane protein TolC